MPLVNRTVGGEKIEVLLSVHIPHFSTSPLSENHRQGMIVMRSVTSFQINVMLCLLRNFHGFILLFLFSYLLFFFVRSLRGNFSKVSLYGAFPCSNVAN